MRNLELRNLSKEYMEQSRFVINEYASFCAGQEAAHPWLLRQKYLVQRAALRSKHLYSASYLETDGRELRYFLRWYDEQIALGEVILGELSTEHLQAYWSTQRRPLPHRRVILSRHARPWVLWLQQRRAAEPNDALDVLVRDYFEQHHSAMRGKGYGIVLTHRAKIVTRRHLVWMEQHEDLPTGTAAAGVVWSGAESAAASVIEDAGGLVADNGKNKSQALLDHFVVRVDRDLPQGLRLPLVEYLEHLVHERELVKRSIASILHTNLALCRELAEARHDSFARLRVSHLDAVVSSLLCAPHHDLLRRRRQVQARNSNLRGFLRYLHRRGVLDRDLASVLISPPCYRASTPPTVLSEEQVQQVLEAVNRRRPRGRRCHAILMLMTTYGLRPVDVSRLQLDDVHWRAQRIALVQSKTRRVLVQPLLPEVAEALFDYLRQDRVPGLCHRQLFVSLDWPHQSLTARTISIVVARALREAGMAWARAKHLRASVATHLLRQGTAFCTIQEVLGHRTAETTQRYAVTDLEMMRQVLDESER